MTQNGSLISFRLLTSGPKRANQADISIGHIFKHFPDPKSAYVADWNDLPSWQQETDAEIFERIEQDT
jgi:hypothetical protein